MCQTTKTITPATLDLPRRPRTRSIPTTVGGPRGGSRQETRPVREEGATAMDAIFPRDQEA